MSWSSANPTCAATKRRASRMWGVRASERSVLGVAEGGSEEVLGGEGFLDAEEEGGERAVDFEGRGSS